MREEEKFNIQDVSRVTGLPTHIILYWETEFLQIKPQRDQSRQRIYSRKDLDVISRVQHLLFETGSSIRDAKIAITDEFG